jgi:hypothetical protein
MKSILRTGAATLLAGVLCAAVAVAPAGAATRPSLASITHSVHAADGALLKLRRLAASNPAAAKQALTRSRSQIAAAAHEARALRGHASPDTTTKAFGLLAGQYDRALQTYTSLIGGTGGSLQGLLAQALQPTLAGRTQALGFLGQLTGLLSPAGAGAATGTIAGLLGNAPTEIQSLTGLFSAGQLPTSIQALIGQAITTAGGFLDAGLAQLKSLIPTLPAPAQSAVEGVLTALTTALGQVKSTLTGLTQTIGGLLPGAIGQTITGQLGQVLSMLQGFLGTAGGTPTGGTTGTGTTGTGTTGAGTTGAGTTAGGLLGGFLGSLPVPPFITNLLSGFKLGSLLPTGAPAH